MLSPGRNSPIRLGLLTGTLAACLLPAAQSGAAETAVVCQGRELARGTVATIVDGRSFLLSDGREVKLAAIEVPAGARARAALAELMAGRDVTLHGRSESDRYGRLVAFATVSGSETPIQYALLAKGQARFAGLAEDKDCRAGLLRQENTARAGKLGLWADPVYAIRRSETPAAIERGRFAVVEGRVLSVRESGATIYVNFGRRWSEDFTVTIARRNHQAFVAAGLEPKSLAGRDIRVRGFVEERGGPLIEAAHK